jgi:hypothetical protein
MNKNDSYSAYLPIALAREANVYAQEIDRPFSYVVTQALARYLVQVGAIPIVGELTPEMDWREIDERRLGAAKEQGE